MKKILKPPVFSVYSLCAVSLITAVTAVLSIFCTFRIGSVVKIPMKFISVFVASSLFGPWVGGLCGAVGDILNLLLAPSGTPLPLLTVIEFFYGFLFGLFFYLPPKKMSSHIFRCIGCAFFVFLTDIFASSAVLFDAGYFPSFRLAVMLRLPAGIIKTLMHFVCFIFGRKLTDKIKKTGGYKN